MGLHTFLALNQIEYESEDAVEFSSVYFLLLNYWSLVESHAIAKERDKRFYKFEKSKYADGSYFDKYINEDWSPKQERVKQLFDGIPLPTKEDWIALKEAVILDGLYHQYRLAVAP